MYKTIFNRVRSFLWIFSTITVCGSCGIIPGLVFSNYHGDADQTRMDHCELLPSDEWDRIFDSFRDGRYPVVTYAWKQGPCTNDPENLRTAVTVAECTADEIRRNPETPLLQVDVVIDRSENDVISALGWAIGEVSILPKASEQFENCVMNVIGARKLKQTEQIIFPPSKRYLLAVSIRLPSVNEYHAIQQAKREREEARKQAIQSAKDRHAKLEKYLNDRRKEAEELSEAQKREIALLRDPDELMRNVQNAELETLIPALGNLCQEYNRRLGEIDGIHVQPVLDADSLFFLSQDRNFNLFEKFKNYCFVGMPGKSLFGSPVLEQLGVVVAHLDDGFVMSFTPNATLVRASLLARFVGKVAIAQRRHWLPIAFADGYSVLTNHFGEKRRMPTFRLWGIVGFNGFTQDSQGKYHWRDVVVRVDRLTLKTVEAYLRGRHALQDTTAQGSPNTIACGSQRWKAFHDSVVAYCKKNPVVDRQEYAHKHDCSFLQAFRLCGNTDILIEPLKIDPLKAREDITYVIPGMQDNDEWWIKVRRTGVNWTVKDVTLHFVE